MRIGTLYSASDKSLFDALNQKKVTNNDLRQLFQSRGIFISKDTSRKDLASHFARLFHDYHDYQLLARLFGSANQRDKFTSLRIKTDATLETFQSGAFELKTELEQAGATVKVYTAQGNRLDIEVKYSKVQFNKSEFRQVSTRTARISIHKDNGEFVVYSPHSDETYEWVNKIAKCVNENTEQPLVFDEIRLSPSLDAKKKTEFFTQLIRVLPGLQLKDVSDVYVTKPRQAQDDEDDDGDDGSPEIRIDKASLRGKGVLESDELKLLQSKGFYVSKIIWTCEQPHLVSDIYEFEAQFSSPDECTDFTYLPRGFYKRTVGGLHNQTRTAFSTEEEHKYGQLIEAAARSTLQKIMGQTHG